MAPDNLNQIGRYIRHTGRNADLALKRVKDKTPKRERARDTVSSVHPFVMHIQTESNPSASLEINFSTYSSASSGVPPTQTAVPRPPPPSTPSPPPAGESEIGDYPDNARITLNGVNNSIIENKTFTNTTAGLSAIHLLNCSNITIRNCDFVDVPGCVYVYNSTNITIEDCRYSNITGPHERVGNNVGNFVQTNQSNGIMIQRNKGKGGDTEDIVSIFNSQNATVQDNHFEGTNWDSPSGSGIALGDYGGSNNIARRNILVNPGQVGIFIAGGTSCSIIENVIIKPQGSNGGSGDVGVYVWAQGGVSCSNHTVSNNRVLWYRAAGGTNPYWNAGNCGPVAGSNNIWNDTTLSADNYRVVF